MDCYVFDTGALVGAEKRKQRALHYVFLARTRQIEVVTPVVCILEWWRSRTDANEKLLESIVVEPLLLKVAKRAGEALARIGRPIDARLTIDAAVAAHASMRGAVVITSDPDDFDDFREFFPTLRVLSI